MFYLNLPLGENVGVTVVPFYNQKTLHVIMNKVGYRGREFHEHKMSETEKKVLALLAKEGRLPLTALAQKLHTSISTVKYAMKKLFAKKILIGFDALLDLQKIGYMLTILS